MKKGIILLWISFTTANARADRAQDIRRLEDLLVEGFSLKKTLPQNPENLLLFQKKMAATFPRFVPVDTDMIDALERSLVQHLQRSFVPPETPDFRRGESLFAKHCAGCHGAGGQGDGVFADRLPARPPSLTRSEWMPRVNFMEISAIIKRGIPSTAMAGLEDLLTDEEVYNLSFYVLALRFPEEASSLSSSSDISQISLYDLVYFTESELQKRTLDSRANFFSILRRRITYDRNTLRFSEQLHEQGANSLGNSLSLRKGGLIAFLLFCGMVIVFNVLRHRANRRRSRG